MSPRKGRPGEREYAALGTGGDQISDIFEDFSDFTRKIRKFFEYGRKKVVRNFDGKIKKFFPKTGPKW